MMSQFQGEVVKEISLQLGGDDIVDKCKLRSAAAIDKLGQEGLLQRGV